MSGIAGGAKVTRGAGPPRRRGALIAAAAAILWAPAIHASPEKADERPVVVGSAAMGAGAIGGDPATAVDLGVDIAGRAYAVGLGGRIHYTTGGGFRTEDWDEASEVLGIIRYAIYDDELGDALTLAAAAGELGDVRHGHGTVLAGYASGLFLDHGRFGAQLRAAHDAVVAEATVDDLVRPRVLGLRTAADVSRRARLGVSFTADVRAPAAGGRAAVGIAAVDGEIRGDAAEGRYRGRLYLDAASAAGLGSGLHLGAGGSAEVGDPGARIGARAELRLAAGGYIPGYFSSLYERDRQVIEPGPGGGASQLDLARRGGLGGVAGLGELSLEWPGIGVGSLTYAARPALADHLITRLEAPYLHRVQGALWGAVTTGSGAGRGGALAAELRVVPREPMVVSLDAARLYRARHDSAPEPVWTVIASVGAVLGE